VSKGPESIRASMIDRTWDTAESSPPAEARPAVTPSRAPTGSGTMARPAVPKPAELPPKKAQPPAPPSPSRASSPSVRRSMPTPASGVTASR
jgi:hypothetical protein